MHILGFPVVVRFLCLNFLVVVISVLVDRCLHVLLVVVGVDFVDIVLFVFLSMLST